MHLIINNSNFEEDKIHIKHSKNTKKILYTIGDIAIIGIPLKLNNINIISQTNKYINLNIETSEEKIILKKIDAFFLTKYGNYYFSFIKDNILKIRKNYTKLYKEKDEIYISITNIKNKSSFITIQLFTI